MSPERRRQVERLYHAALDKDQAHRAGFLAQAAVDDEELRREVESLLAQNSANTESMTADGAIGVEGRFTPGVILGKRYRIVAPLGCGGMGEVYRATDLVLRQTVALKFLPESLANNPRALNRLYNEVRLARQVSHPNVCRVYDVAEAAGLHFLTMEYVDGEDLRSLLRRIGRVPVEKATEMARRLCAGVTAAHERGVLHRDLKPANVMIDAQGIVRITDFGLAVLADCGEIHDLRSGTPAYMAPEQLAGEEVTLRSDIYSLGLVLCELFGGNHPFKDIPRAALLRQKRETKARDLSLSTIGNPEIERAVRRCLEPNSRDRPSSAAVVAIELSGGVLEATIAAGETPGPELVARAGAAEGLPVRAAIACLSAVIAALIIFAVLTPRISVLRHMRVETPDALEKVARETLSSFGLHEGIKHHVGRFSYDTEALPKHFGSSGLYYWYRASPSWMVPHELTGVISLGNPPGELPGMIATKWDSAGRLLYLKWVPLRGGTSAMAAPEMWTRLFNAAGLQLARFEPAESGWIPAPGWDTRASWTGAYLDDEKTPVRIEAAAWHGQPVYFEVVPGWRNGTDVPAVVTAQRYTSAQFAIFVVLFSASAVLARRNVHLGRGDRRGASRIALLIFCATFLKTICEASHVPSIEEFTILAFGACWAGFVAAGFWTIYMAFEPYVRRRWPHVIVSWTRVLAGNLRDPVVGAHILIGTAFGAVAMAVITIGLSVAGSQGPWMPSSRMFSGPRGALALALQLVVDAVPRGLTLMFLAFFFKVFFRREWLAACGTAALAAMFQPPTPLTPIVNGALLAALAVGLVYLLLRSGLTSVVVAVYVFTILSGLPIMTDLSAPGTGASILMLCGLAALAVFGFRSTLAGRQVVKLDL